MRSCPRRPHRTRSGRSNKLAGASPLSRPPRLPLTAITQVLASGRTCARPPSRPWRAAALRRVREPHPLRRGRQPAHGRVLALHGGRRPDRRGAARPRRGRRGGALPLVRLDQRHRGRARDRRGHVNHDAAADPAAQAHTDPLPDLPETLLAGYLDAALDTLRAADPGSLPWALRQYQTWTPRRLRHPRVLGLVRRTLDLDKSFRDAVDKRVLDQEQTLARLLRSGRHAEALASGEAPEMVARVGPALGSDGAAASPTLATISGASPLASASACRPLRSSLASVCSWSSTRLSTASLKLLSRSRVRRTSPSTLGWRSRRGVHVWYCRSAPGRLPGSAARSVSRAASR